MKKILLVFTFSWVIFSLISSGYEVLQPKWRETIKQSPRTVQAQAGDIYNQGAIIASGKLDNNPPPEALLFVDEASGLLHALPLVYWLSPTYLRALVNEPFTQDRAHLNPSKSLKETLGSRNFSVVYFIGNPKTLDENKEFLHDFRIIPITSAQDKVFVKLEYQK